MGNCGSNAKRKSGLHTNKLDDSIRVALKKGNKRNPEKNTDVELVNGFVPRSTHPNLIKKKQAVVQATEEEEGGAGSVTTGSTMPEEIR
jgi:hypothetical protein